MNEKAKYYIQKLQLNKHPEGGYFKEVYRGGALFQVVIKNHTWFAAEVISKRSFALSGCTVSPGFDFSDF